MTRLFSKLPWFATAPALVVAGILVAVGLNYFVGPFFERSFLDEPDPLAVVLPVATLGAPPALAKPREESASLPTATPNASPTAAPAADPPTAAASASAASSPTSVAAAATPIQASPMTPPNTPVPETATPVQTPATQPALLALGSFRDGEPGHNGRGAARVIRDAAGALVLRFENFSVTNGPDLHVFLTTTDGYEGERIDLGKLKATDGNQNYAIPAGTDVSKYKSVLVWCVPFRVLFTIATLGAP